MKRGEDMTIESYNAAMLKLAEAEAVALVEMARMIEKELDKT